MKKLAIFVEGPTELTFVEKLLLEIGNKKQISIRKEILSGGGKCPVISHLIGEIPETKSTKYKILLYSSCNDEKVLSDIKDRYNDLKSKGYGKIIGLRDLYPIEYSKKDEIKNLIRESLIRFKLSDATIVLAIMEIETWFLAELTHYNRLHPNLTINSIRLSVTDLEKIKDFEREVGHPAELLNKIYHLVGYAYRKKEKQVQRTVNNLGYTEMYIDLRNKLSSLNEFITYLDDFF